MIGHSFAKPQSKFARLIPVSGGLALECTYDADLIRDFKSRLPPEGRRWDPDRKRWLIAPQYADLVAKLCAAYLGVTVAVPKQATAPVATTELVQLIYLGRTKDRGNGESSAFGYADGTWKLIFPEAVLRDWFDAVPQRPGELPTLYAVLAIKPVATPEEIKKAHRRLALQWHPDRCKDNDAAEQFKIIQSAYEVLSDPLKRRKYEAGLTLEASLRQPARRPYSVIPDPNGYRPPLKCGWVLVDGTESLGRFIVARILEWQDVVNAQGQSMVTSWPMGADKPTISWS